VSVRQFFPGTAWNVSPMNLNFFEGSNIFNKPVLGFDLETYSPNGFPDSFEDPIVNFSLAVQSKAGVLILSFISEPAFELELLKILREMLEILNGGILFTYNGARFDVRYAVRRAALYDLDIRSVFGGFRHFDLYRMLRSRGVQLRSYGQKSVESLFGIKRVVTEVSGANYFRYYLDFWEEGDLKPIFYNIEDSVGCLRLADRFKSFLGLNGTI